MAAQWLGDCACSAHFFDRFAKEQQLLDSQDAMEMDRENFSLLCHCFIGDKSSSSALV